MSNQSIKDKKLNSLILITNHFPYGLAEAFLESELKYLVHGFDQVIILARDVTSPETRVIDNYLAYRINPESSWKEKTFTFFLYLKHLKRAVNYLREEIQYLRSKKKPITLAVSQTMIHDLTKAIITSYQIKKIIQKHVTEGNVMLYSYWLTSTALATTFVDRSPGITVKKISRAHGGDIYDYRNNLHYLSFRASLIKHLDHIYTVSENGCHYLSQSGNPQHKNKISVSRLGIHDSGQTPAKKPGPLLLISCSFLHPVKQIHLIIESLELIHKIELQWIHIGDGPLRREMENLAKKKLNSKKNIKYQFKGSISNKELLQFYSQQFVDLFINTSSSEGIPVTMMEVQSKGIPIVAFNVGGISELVSAENGKLLPPNSPPEHIAQAIEEILTLPEKEYQHLRTRAFQSWESKYNAERNFSTFVAEILNIQHEAR